MKLMKIIMVGYVGGRGWRWFFINGKGNRYEWVIDGNMVDGINFKGEVCFIGKWGKIYVYLFFCNDMYVLNYFVF